MKTVQLKITQVEVWLQHRLKWLDLRTDGWFMLFFQAFRDMISFKSSLYAAATAYFTLYSIFPLILLTVSLSSFWFQPYLDTQMILDQFEFIVPGLDDMLGQNLKQLFDARGAITRLSALILVWSASSIVYMLTRAMDAIWEEVMIRPAWRHRALAIAVTIAICILLLIGSFGWSVVVPILNEAMPDRLIDVAGYVSVLGSALLSATLFTLLYKMLPHASLEWGDVMLGAVISGLLWEVAKHGFLYFVTNYLTLSNLVYGSMTAIIAFLTWAYISMLIFLFGAHVNVLYRRRRLKRLATAGQR